MSYLSWWLEQHLFLSSRHASFQNGRATMDSLVVYSNHDNTSALLLHLLTLASCMIMSGEEVFSSRLMLGVSDTLLNYCYLGLPTELLECR